MNPIKYTNREEFLNIWNNLNITIPFVEGAINPKPTVNEIINMIKVPPYRVQIYIHDQNGEPDLLTIYKEINEG